MKKIIQFIFISWILGILFIIPSIALAQTATDTTITTQSQMLQTLTKVGGEGGFQTGPTATVPIIVGTVVRGFIGLFGLIFIILIILAGFKWMTANGNEEEVKKATTSLKNSIIGLIIALSAWSIWTFIFEKLILMK